MKNVTRNIFILRFIVSVLIAIVLILPTWYWVSPETLSFTGQTIAIVDEYGGMHKLTVAQKIGGYMATMLPNTILVAALVILLKILKRLSNSQWFEEANERDWATVGYLMLGYVGAEIIHHTLLGLILTINNPVGERVLYIGFDSGDFKALVPALLALVISYMVSIARRQRDELNEIV